MKKLTNAEDGIAELPVKYPSFPNIRVIPGRERQKPLSKHSIPFYYKEGIKDFWTTGNVSTQLIVLIKLLALNKPSYELVRILGTIYF